jgi:hypothetical protein
LRRAHAWSALPGTSREEWLDRIKEEPLDVAFVEPVGIAILLLMRRAGYLKPPLAGWGLVTEKPLSNPLFSLLKPLTLRRDELVSLPYVCRRLTCRHAPPTMQA